jgi:hypothetical protein
MSKYKITGKTNVWIARRDIHFNGKTSINIKRNLDIKEAQSELLRLFNKDYDTSYKNWGLVRCNTREGWSSGDGARGYEYDSRYYQIEEEDVTYDELVSSQFLDFDENDYDTKDTSVSFNRFIDNILDEVYENNGTIDDAVDIANDAFSKL